jgi:hypothetical protein
VALFNRWGVRLYRLPETEVPPPAVPAPPLNPDPPDADALWSRLADEDGEKGFKAVWELVNRPGRAVALLRRRLRPVAPPTDRTARLIRELDSDKQKDRHEAEKELRRLGEAAEPALRRAARGECLDVRMWASRLLRELDARARAGTTCRLVRAVEALELIATPDARALLAWLASGDPDARLTRETRWSLHRLDRRK